MRLEVLSVRLQILGARAHAAASTQDDGLAVLVAVREQLRQVLQLGLVLGDDLGVVLVDGKRGVSGPRVVAV